MINEAERIAIVSGATAGIGLAVANKLIDAGAYVVGVGRREDRLETLEKSVFSKYSEKRFVGLPGDITDSDTLKELMLISERSFGREADIFVVNAGKGLPHSILESDESKWEELFQLNCLSAMRQMKAAAQSMLIRAKNRVGAPQPQDIIILGSIVGRHLSPVNPVYGATKFAIHSLAEALRREMAPFWIRVTLIEPGTVQTEFQEVAGYDATTFKDYEQQVGPFITGEDIANFILFIISQPAHVHFSDVVIRPTRQVYP